jgi:hypothetical protein
MPIEQFKIRVTISKAVKRFDFHIKESLFALPRAQIANAFKTSSPVGTLGFDAIPLSIEMAGRQLRGWY